MITRSKQKCLVLSWSGRTCHAATDDVDFDAGSDSNVGTSRNAAGKTLEKADGLVHVSTADYFVEQRLGRARSVGAAKFRAEGARIAIDRYGGGSRPRIDGGGQVEDAVRLRNVQFIEVPNLEVTNHGEVLPG